MNASRLWLEAFLRRPLNGADVADRLAMLGASVDAIEPLHPGLGDIVVGLVESVRPHPNADRLRVCTVNDGGAAPRSVVCGAPNVEAGKRYPFAPIGAVLPGDFKIEKRKIRGEASEGMLCSARELGLGQDHDGILELSTEAAPGTPFLAVMPVADERIVVDVTPNRPDLLGHKGLARELAASYGVPFRLPILPGSPGMTAPSPVRAGGEIGTVGGVRFGTLDPHGCPRFLGAVLRDVKVGPSPAWLAERLTAVGMRSINNVVDATNYVMFELAQPMHAYDVARLRGPSVIARRAHAGERLVTLDGVDRTLGEDMVVIADDAGAVGVAGVMGAAHVEVTAETTTVFLECAAFEPRRVRRARRALGISTEASQRFERGVDRWNGAEALRRCIEVIQATGGGTLDGDPVDVWPEPSNPPRIFLRPERVARLLGVALPWSKIEQYLVAIGATVLAKPDDGRMAVDVPGYRPDLLREIDLIEEIARLHGYDNFPDTLLPFRLGTTTDGPAAGAVARVRRGLVAQGLFEAQTLPMGAAEGPESVALLNPLSAEEGFLRQTLLPGLIRRVEANWSRHHRDVRLFEIGTVFASADPGERPRETLRVAAVVSGAREPAHWSAGGKAPDMDVWDLKGIFESAIALAVPAGRLQVDDDSLIAVHPDGRTAGRAQPIAVDAPAWAAPVLGFELSIDLAPVPAVGYTPLPVTPASERDLALVLPPDVSAASVERVLRRQGGALLEQVDIFDEYRGAGLPEGHRGVGFRLRFRAPDRTLLTAEVDAAVGRCVTALEKELGIHLRTA
jgi:phenylalanyl-tRNA synthetase beta chain